MSDVKESPYLPRQHLIRKMVLAPPKLPQAKQGQAQNDVASEAEFADTLEDPAAQIEGANCRYYNKNAFRYICRIAFKEACTSEYRERVKEGCATHGIRTEQLLEVFSKAETISGPRFFHELVAELEHNVARAMIDFLLWFLSRRYLRYLDRGPNPRRRPNNRT